MVNDVKLFKSLIIVGTVILLGYINMFPNTLSEHISGVSFTYACCGFVMALYVKNKKNPDIRKMCRSLDRYIGPFFVCVIIASINTYVSYDYTLKDVFFEFTNFFYAFLAYPLVYIYYKEKRKGRFLSTIGKLVIGIVAIKFFCWILYTFMGITIFENILFQYNDWVRDGQQRIDAGYLFGFTYCIFLYKALQKRSRLFDKIIVIFLFVFMIFVTRFRAQAIAMTLTAAIVYFVSGKNSKIKTIRFTLMITAFITAVSLGVFDKLIDSFSTIGSRSGSTIGRLLSLYHYWNLLVSRKAVLGLGFLNASVSDMAYGMMRRDPWRIYYIGDTGIFGGFVWFGVLAFIVYGLLFFYAVKVCKRVYKRKNDELMPMLFSIVSYMIISCLVLNIFDAQRSYDVPFYLSIIALFDYRIQAKNAFEIDKDNYKTIRWRLS